VDDEDKAYSFTNELHDEELAEALRAFMKWIYRQLEREYDYLTSDEAIAESIIANEYEFTEEGERYQ
jgi:hypothetical protein